MGGRLGPVCDWLAGTSLSHTIQAIDWVIPAVQTVHILCVGVLFSSAVLVDLRLLGLLGKRLPLYDVAQRHFPIIWPVLIVLLITGSILIIGEPRRSLGNFTFYLKMALLAVAIVVTIALQKSISRSPHLWDRNPGRRRVGRIGACFSMLVWCGILFAGRWIAYTQVD